MQLKGSRHNNYATVAHLFQEVTRAQPIPLTNLDSLPWKSGSSSSCVCVSVGGGLQSRASIFISVGTL